MLGRKLEQNFLSAAELICSVRNRQKAQQKNRPRILLRNLTDYEFLCKISSNFYIIFIQTVDLYYTLYYNNYNERKVSCKLKKYVHALRESARRNVIYGKEK